jgi:hypothetical protein
VENKNNEVSRGLYLTPRPGLEPGTYGLTAYQALEKLKINNLRQKYQLCNKLCNNLFVS